MQLKTTKTDFTLKDALEKMGFVSRPNLEGNPDFAHFDTKVAVYFGSKAELAHKTEMERVEERRQRFKALRSKGWRVVWIAKEDKVEKSLNLVKNLMTGQNYARYRLNLPRGASPDLVKSRLIELLKQTERERHGEEGKKRGNYAIIWGIKKRRRKIEQYLHHILRPVILKRDGYKCRACGSTINLEIVRLYGGLFWPFEERWSEKNMFVLCRDCHKRFDSFNGRMWRGKLKLSSVGEAVQLLKSGKIRLWREGPLKLPPTIESFKKMTEPTSNAKKVYDALKKLDATSPDSLKTADDIMRESRLLKGMTNNALMELVVKGYAKRVAHEKATGYYLTK